jgi:hypothetical protein
MPRYTQKAIKTKYKSITFRSRLEARWAIFFDTLGIRYKYEEKSYAVLGGIWYLPDFTLINVPVACIIEVKPNKPTKGEVAKCRSLSTQVGLVAIVAGVPNTDVEIILFNNGSEMEVDWSDQSVPDGFPKDKLENLNKLAFITNRTDFVKAFKKSLEKKFA